MASCVTKECGRDRQRDTLIPASDVNSVGGVSLQQQQGGCDVYVWGSNSSHQLAEGAQDKLSLPKKTAAFTDVMEVFGTRRLNTFGSVNFDVTFQY
jgi:hypothetical protein